MQDLAVTLPMGGTYFSDFVFFALVKWMKCEFERLFDAKATLLSPLCKLLWDFQMKNAIKVLNDIAVIIYYILS